MLPTWQQQKPGLAGSGLRLFAKRRVSVLLMFLLTQLRPLSEGSN